MTVRRQFAALAFLAASAVLGSSHAQAQATDPFVEAARVAQRPVQSTYNGVYGGVQQVSAQESVPYESAPYESVPYQGAPYQATQYAPGGYPGGEYIQPSAEPCMTSEMVGPVASWGYAAPANSWGWQVLPDGLIYRSYQAGPRESRLGLHTFQNSYPAHGPYAGQKSEWAWDATLGGRKGIIRYGSFDDCNPVGWQLDFEGATIVRLNLDENRDVDSSDFRFGVPLTYTAGDGVAYKLGYYHLSSHLGDELIARNGANTRVNYVRDAIIAGVSYQMFPSLRVYGETAYAFFTAGGAEPWEFQFGAELSRPGPTGFRGTPFIATNAHLREEVDFSGDWTLQTGWLWRGDTGSTLRLGVHYMNGKSTQYQYFNRNEEQVGLGLWCDF
jgi:hypothetical protein